MTDNKKSRLKELFTPELMAPAEVLRSNKLQVPIHQRSYAWGADSADDRNQIEEFWEDLDRARQDKDRGYFLGTVVLSRAGAQDSRLAVIDGQQRLATTSILLAAMRHHLHVLGETGRVSLIDPCIYSFDPDKEENVPQLVLNAEDDRFFRQLVVDRVTASTAPPLADPGTKQSHIALRAAYDYFVDRLTEQLDAAPESKALLDEWFKLLNTRAALMVVEVADEADAYLVFETLNDRGADLTIADLLKNYLFGLAGDQLETVKNAWAAALNNLDISTTGSHVFTEFLRHYWSSKYGPTRERELYSRIKDRVTTKANAVDLAEEIETASRLYAAIISSDHELWAEHPKEAKRQMQILVTLRIEQNRSLLLAALQFIEPKELTTVLRGLVAVGVRGLIVGGIGGGTAEKSYCQAAQAVRQGTSRNWVGVRSELAKILHSDVAFEKAFAAAKVTRGPFARYLLAALERSSEGTAQPELVPNEDQEQVNLEHVLPKTFDEHAWPAFTKDSHATYLHRLGNLCLLKKDENGRIGNKPFSEKQPVLDSSSLSLTKEIAANSDWTATEIERRQTSMATDVSKVWQDT